MAKGALTVLNQNCDVFKGKKKLSKATENIGVAEKENTPILRRSKRKVTAVSTGKLNKDLSLPSKTRSNAKNIQSLKAKSKAVPKVTKEYSTTVIKEISNKTQSKSNLSPVATNQHVSESSNPANTNLLISTPSCVSDDSGFESSTRVSDHSLGQTQPVLDLQSTEDTAIDDESCILTSDTAPLSYWRELAEQRRKSLEKALQENELLHDQLAVLEAENSQLKQLVKEAEEIAKIIEGTIE